MDKTLLLNLLGRTLMRRLCMALLILPCSTGGCSAPRAAMLKIASLHDIPTVPQGTRQHLMLDPFVGSLGASSANIPSVTVRIRTVRPTADTLEWYQKTLRKSGWHFEASDAYNWNAEKEMAWSYRATRIRGSEPIPVCREQITLYFHLHEPDDQTIVDITYAADYLGATPAGKCVEFLWGAALVSPAWTAMPWVVMAIPLGVLL